MLIEGRSDNKMDANLRKRIDEAAIAAEVNNAVIVTELKTGDVYAVHKSNNTKVAVYYVHGAVYTAVDDIIKDYNISKGAVYLRFKSDRPKWAQWILISRARKSG